MLATTLWRKKTDFLGCLKVAASQKIRNFSESVVSTFCCGVKPQQNKSHQPSDFQPCIRKRIEHFSLKVWGKWNHGR
jgi:hypothetical protein